MGIQNFTKICLNNKLSKNEKVCRKDALYNNMRLQQETYVETMYFNYHLFEATET